MYAILQIVSSDTKAVIGTIVGTGLVMAGLLLTQVAGVNSRIDDVNTRIGDMNARMARIEMRLDGFDERLRNVEIAFAKVDQRLLTIERVVLPASTPGQ